MCEDNFLYWNLSPAPDCDSQPPKVNNATISTHETGSMFIIGSQVNYSCSEGCMLQGNYSLTCQVQYHVATWPDPPTCSCPGENAYLVCITIFDMSLW